MFRISYESHEMSFSFHNIFLVIPRAKNAAAFSRAVGTLLNWTLWIRCDFLSSYKQAMQTALFNLRLFYWTTFNFTLWWFNYKVFCCSTGSLLPLRRFQLVSAVGACFPVAIQTQLRDGHISTPQDYAMKNGSALCSAAGSVYVVETWGRASFKPRNHGAYGPATWMKSLLTGPWAALWVSLTGLSFRASHHSLCWTTPVRRERDPELQLTCLPLSFLWSYLRHRWL